MPNFINKAITREYEDAFPGAIDTLVLQPVGMNVEDATRFRVKLSAAGLRMRVVKGALARRVFEARGLKGLDALFSGPAAVVERSDPAAEVELVAVAAARVVAAWRKESGNELPAVKGGVLDGEVLARARAEALSKLPTRADLQSRLSGQLLAPGRRLSAQLLAPGGRFAGALKTQIKNLEGAGG